MTRAIACFAALLIAFGDGFVAAGHADDLGNAAPLQREVNAEIDVIKTAGETPSSECLSALQEMHTAEQQLLALTGDPSNAPSGSALAENEQGEVSVGRDVLASDLDGAASACHSDAARACKGSLAGKIAMSCTALSRLKG